VSASAHNGRYPRELSAEERRLIRIVLPESSPGYRVYRNVIDEMVVAGQGRRGSEHLILSRRGSPPDLDSNLTPVIAYGASTQDGQKHSVIVRERNGDRIDVEIVKEPAHGERDHEWTYSMWKPGDVSPCSRSGVREVTLTATDVLAFSGAEHRIWVHDMKAETNTLIPVTGYHGELMVLEGIRDPAVALNPSGLFDLLPRYDDGRLREAFFAYNRIHPKITVPPGPASARKPALPGLLSRWIRSRKSHV